MLRACLMFLLIFVIFSPGVSGQSKDSLRITAHFDKLSIPGFIEQVERLTACHFYYDPSQLTADTIDLSVNNEPLPKLLEQVFKKTGMIFSIDPQNNIFLTKRIGIVTELPPGFYDTNNSSPATQKDSVLDYGLGVKKVERATSQNRLYEIGTATGSNTTKGSALLTGYVRNAKTGEPFANATIFTEGQQSLAATDQYGYYSLTLPVGSHTLTVQGTGMKDAKYQLVVYSNGKLDIELGEQVTTLKEVIVSGKRTANINRVQMGVEHMTIENMRQIPVLFGETDVIRAITTLPGVKTVGEASTGFNVRGGSTDQNLILYNDATIYNPSHFFGMFSAFNPEVIKDVELYKSSIPAKFGGRLSSVLDISSREGNKKNITGSAGIGVITSRMNIEGPLVKDKTSFIFGARTTYANWLLNLLPDEYKDSKASFQDANLGISHRIDSNNNVYFTGYISNDHFSLGSDTTYNYSNRNIAIKWKHNFNSKLNSVFIAGYDQYKYDVTSEKDKANAYKLGFGIKQFHFKTDFNYYINSTHGLDFGLSTIRYNLQPGSFQPVGAESLIAPDVVAHEQAFESALYIAHRYTINSRFTINTGLRFSMFNYLGPKEINIYAPGLPVTETNRTGTRDYKNGQFIKTYQGPEYRLSLRYSITSSFSVKASYNSLRQYIHMLSNTTSIAPTDIWKLSDPNIKPQQGEQVSIGLYKNFKENSIETSVEVYYKKIKDYLDYKPGATLIMNHAIETDVMSTKGKAYGVEVMIKKQEGKLNGWIGYTWSRIFLKSDDPSLGAIVNHGNYYPANYDKPHDVTIAGNFRVNHRFSVSVNSTYSTGRPITLPIGRYFYGGSERVLYSDRNLYRIPDYFRTDFSMNIDGNYKVKQKTHNSWTFGLYNVFGTRNPYSVYFISTSGRVKGYKLSVFGSVIPFINFNIRF
jgi:hypothetical protein